MVLDSLLITTLYIRRYSLCCGADCRPGMAFRRQQSVFDGVIVAE